MSDKQSRTDAAYRRLKESIRANEMPPGYQAPEPEIAAHLGMSRTPVREALIRLEAEGLVALTPRRGARVLPIRAEDMQEIYEILIALEPEAAASLAARRLDADALHPLQAATDEMEKALDADDLDRWAQADDRFHTGLLALHGNRRMQGFVTALFDQAHRARMITLRMRDPPLRSTQEHREILRYLLAGDASATRRAFRAHRKRSAEELLALLKTYRLPQL